MAKNTYLKAIEEASKAMDRIYSQWDNIDQKILEVSKNARKMADVDTSSARPKEVNDHLVKNSEYVKQLNKFLEEQRMLNEALQKQIDKLKTAREKQNKVLSDEEKLQKKLLNSKQRLTETQTEEYKQIVKNRDAANQNTRALRQMESFYGKISLKLKKTAQEYKDLAVRKQILNNLSEEEERKMIMLEGRLDKYSDALIKADQRTGNYSRNVGNYKSGFDGLGHSVAQLTREMPAFANSLQTGFMALSNNIPMLVDEINKLKNANTQLRAEGKPTQSVMKSLGAAMFSWQTLISIGVTVLTVYGAELFELAFGASEAEKAQKKLNEAMAKAGADASNASQEMRTLRDIVTDTTVSEEVRTKALKKLSEEVTELKEVELDQADAMEKVISHTQAYIVATEARAKADAFARLAAEAEAKLMEEKAKGLEDHVKWYDYLTAGVKGFANTAAFTNSLIMSGAKNQTKTVSEQQAVVDMLNDKYREYLETSLELGDILEDNKDPEFAKREKYKAFAIGETNQMVQYSVAWFEALISTLRESQKQTALGTKEWKDYEDQIKGITEMKDFIIEGPKIEANMKGFTDLLDNKIPGAMKNLSNLLGADMDALMMEFASAYEYDWNEFQKFSEKKIQQADKENKIKTEKLASFMQMTSDVIHEVGNLSAALYDRNIQKIEEEIAAKDKLLESDKLSEEQRKLIEKDKAKLEKKKQEEKTKAAKVDKAFAMFDIAINTTAAIMKTYAQLGFPAGIPIAIAMGAIGALQLATVAAKPIPKYKHGRKGGKAELAYTGDGGVNEVVTDSQLKPKFITPNKATLTPLAAGDHVFPNLRAYFDEVSMDDLNRAAIITSLKSQQNSLDHRETQENLNREILNAILEGNRKKAALPTPPDYDRLAYRIAKELNFQRRRDV